MRLYIDTSNVQFTVTSELTEKTDQDGKQKYDRFSKAPLWVVQVMALDEEAGEMLKVTVAGDKPKVSRGQLVVLEGLEALPWNNSSGKSGVAYKAATIRPATAVKAA